MYLVLLLSSVFNKIFANIAFNLQADVKDLPEPITINIISTHVKRFYFAVYQLNTLNLDGNHAINNFWFSLPPIPLYLQCEYQEARPVLQKYVNDVLRHALVFYQS